MRPLDRRVSRRQSSSVLSWAACFRMRGGGGHLRSDCVTGRARGFPLCEQHGGCRVYAPTTSLFRLAQRSTRRKITALSLEMQQRPMGSAETAYFGEKAALGLFLSFAGGVGSNPEDEAGMF